MSTVHLSDAIHILQTKKSSELKYANQINKSVDEEDLSGTYHD